MIKIAFMMIVSIEEIDKIGSKLIANNLFKSAFFIELIIKWAYIIKYINFKIILLNFIQ
tara:strand:- start:80 stop:256 length:177 start_codon:yes stop_codon:yes gene_type:complete